MNAGLIPRLVCLSVLLAALALSGCATVNEQPRYETAQALDEARSQLETIESEIRLIDEKRDQPGLTTEVRDELFDKRLRLEAERVRASQRLEQLERETQRFAARTQ
jgi:hypothetical protein